MIFYEKTYMRTHETSPMSLSERFKDDECLFCRMINNKEPCDIITESPQYMAIYYTSSRHIGHTLIFPKEHIDRYQNISNKKEFFSFVDLVHDKIVNIHEPNSITIKINSGKESVQLIPHICCHIIPQYKV